MARRIIGPSAWLGAAAGLVIGAAAAGLAAAGNPGNMGLCIACFVRDTAGAFGGAAVGMGGVAYLRPEILGLLLGAFVASFAAREFRARGGSAFLLRFVLGFVFMASALIFLGCTVRAWLRLGGGDLNAAVGIAGLVAGIGVGVLFLRSGFNLGRAGPVATPLGWIGPAVAALLLALAVAVAAGAAPGFLTQTPAGKGPGGSHAPLAISLVAGLLLGALAQRSRFCSVGGIRDAILIRRFDLLFGVLGLLVGSLVANLLLGQFRLGFAGQPVAHTDLLGNFVAMTVAGLAAVMLGGCPFRQVVMTGEGDVDAGGAVLGMFAGALFAHGLGVSSSPKGLTPAAWPALGVMAALLVGIALWKRERAPSAAPANAQPNS